MLGTSGQARQVLSIAVRRAAMKRLRVITRKMQWIAPSKSIQDLNNNNGRFYKWTST